MVLVLYGDKGQSQPLLIGEQDDYQFASGATDNFTVSSVKFLNGTPEIFAVNYLKFRERGQTLGYFVKKTQME